MNLKKISDSNRDHDWAFLMARYKMPEVIQALQSSLSEDVIYIDESDVINGFGIENEPHVTLFPCLDPDTNLMDILPYLPKIESLAVSLSNVSLFDNSDYQVLKADVTADSPVHSLNKELAKFFESGSEFKEYHPHMTIAYLKKDYDASHLLHEFEEPIVLSPEFYEFSTIKGGGNIKCKFFV